MSKFGFCKLLNEIFYSCCCFAGSSCLWKAQWEAFSAINQIVKGSVREVDGTWEFVYGLHQDYPAFGTFDPLLNKTGRSLQGVSRKGWGILRVETNPEYSNEIQSYAAGFLEGYLTENDIYIYSVNTYDEKEPPKAVRILGLCLLVDPGDSG